MIGTNQKSIRWKRVAKRGKKQVGDDHAFAMLALTDGGLSAPQDEDAPKKTAGSVSVAALFSCCPAQHTHTRTRTHAHTHTRTHAHAHTHTRTQNTRTTHAHTHHTHTHTHAQHTHTHTHTQHTHTHTPRSESRVQNGGSKEGARRRRRGRRVTARCQEGDCQFAHFDVFAIFAISFLYFFRLKVTAQFCSC